MALLMEVCLCNSIIDNGPVWTLVYFVLGGLNFFFMGIWWKTGWRFRATNEEVVTAALNDIKSLNNVTVYHIGSE